MRVGESSSRLGNSATERDATPFDQADNLVVRGHVNRAANAYKNALPPCKAGMEATAKQALLDWDWEALQRSLVAPIPLSLTFRLASVCAIPGVGQAPLSRMVGHAGRRAAQRAARVLQQCDLTKVGASRAWLHAMARLAADKEHVELMRTVCRVLCLRGHTLDTDHVFASQKEPGWQILGAIIEAGFDLGPLEHAKELAYYATRAGQGALARRFLQHADTTPILGPEPTIQRTVLDLVRHREPALAAIALPKLQKRVAAMGFSPADLDRCCDYLRHRARVVINFDPARAPHIVALGHYLNCFDTQDDPLAWKNKQIRTGKDEQLFGYPNTTPGSKRPLFGSVNGAKWSCAAEGYGVGMLEVPDALRGFITVTAGDSFYARASGVGTLLGPWAHVLLGLSKDHLWRVMLASRSPTAGARASRIDDIYIEGQIHHPLEVLRMRFALRREDAPHVRPEYIAAMRTGNFHWRGPYFASQNKRRETLSLMEREGWNVSAWLGGASDAFAFHKGHDTPFRYAMTDVATSERSAFLQRTGQQGGLIVGYSGGEQSDVFLVKTPVHGASEWRYETAAAADPRDTLAAWNRNGMRVAAMSWDKRRERYVMIGAHPESGAAPLQQRLLSFSARDWSNHRGFHGASGWAKKHGPIAAAALRDRDYLFVIDETSA